jgi:hypothetical protein
MPNKPINCKIKIKKKIDHELKNLVDEYCSTWGESYVIEDAWWGDQNMDWLDAVKRAWLSRLQNGKMHGHQCRVSPKLVKGLSEALRDKKCPEDFTDFAEVYDWTQSVTHRVKGLGTMTAYDVARRLGAWLKISPSSVYLHSGTKIGANRLGIYGDVVALNQFPQEIQSLGSTHAENFLCLYKESLYKTMNSMLDTY